MLAIPHGRKARCFWTLLAGLFCATGCFGDDSGSSQTQRRIGEARLQDDLSVSLTYGSVRAFNSEQLVMRSASPLVEVTFESGPAAVGPIAVELRNQHREAELRVGSATFLDADALSGCPVVTGASLDCTEAAEQIGSPCETSGQCPDGLRCAVNECTPNDLFDSCVPPDFGRIPGQETSLRFDMPIEPCMRITLETILPADAVDSVMKFGVVGPTGTHETIVELGPDFLARDLDFVVLLGDNVARNNEAGLTDLELALARLGTPVVVVAGPDELAAESGDAFLRRFGPHDHVWRLNGTRFFAFYSAPGTLGDRGLERIDEFLTQLGRGENLENSPLIGVTHVPPFDSNGLRDNGFRSEHEAARLISLFESQGVHQLYAGGLGTGELTIQGIELFITTASGTLADPRREWMEVTVGSDGERRIGERAVTARRIAIETEEAALTP